MGQARSGAGERHADVPDPGPRGEGARVQDARGGAVPARPHPGAARSRRRFRRRGRAACPLDLRGGGAGYSGTEFAAQAQLFAKKAINNYPSLRPGEMRWLLVDIAPRVLPELGEHLGEISLQVLGERGIGIRLGTSRESATEEGLTLSDGSFVPTRTLVWCAGVAASPLVSTLGLPLKKGRLVVDEYLSVAGRSDVFAVGDCAAVPDLTRSGEITPPTAQHAVRQGKTAARNIAASLGRGWRGPYRHNDLGLVVDLGGKEAAAKPLGIGLSGVVAKIVTRAYHLYALSSTPQRVRVGLDWILDAVLPRPLVRLRIGKEEDAPLAPVECTGIYEDPGQRLTRGVRRDPGCEPSPTGCWAPRAPATAARTGDLRPETVATNEILDPRARSGGFALPDLASHFTLSMTPPLRRSTTVESVSKSPPN